MKLDNTKETNVIRTIFLVSILIGSAWGAQNDSVSGEVLYNGIQLPAEWPPRDMDAKSREPMPVPYLKTIPKVIPIDIGRQLFVDDFLIEETTLQRQFHLAQKYKNNPVFKPETELELNRDDDRNATACPKDGGIWWDPHLQCFRMWYEAGWLTKVAYATSCDGLKWERPKLDVYPGTNRILDPSVIPDSWTVVPDYEQENPYEHWNMYLRKPGAPYGIRGMCMSSSDGVHWSKPILCGPSGDRSTMFYNPFRKKWVFSLRSSVRGRSSHYWEAENFPEDCQWQSFERPDPQAPVFWAGADKLDLPDAEIGEQTQLYNLDAVAYESLMLGFYEIHLGPPNEVGMKSGLPKITELNLAYSRDGFHWDRPDRRAFIAASRTDTWDRGYVQSVGGICLIRGDKLWFYYSGVPGNPDKLINSTPKNGMYYGGSTGVAFLRRDGFVSMDAGENSGGLTTRPLKFSGRHLFVNADVPQGGLRAEVRDVDGNPIAPFTIENSIAFTGDSTLEPMKWKNGRDLSAFAGKDVRLFFELTNGSLYAFWISRDLTGRSDGYVAGGGPGYTGLVDTVGKAAIEKERRFTPEVLLVK